MLLRQKKGVCVGVGVGGVVESLLNMSNVKIQSPLEYVQFSD